MTSEPVYPPSSYRETRLETILAFIREVGFGQLVSAGEGRPHATAIPFLVREEGRTVMLEAHLQRGNPQWRSIRGEALALFQGPHAYVHPGWYATKKESGRVVPTWNYIAVQAVGPVEIIDDADWLRRHVTALTARHEAGRAEPWTPEDAPAGYIDALLRGIVGMRVTVREFDGRWKLNQNHPHPNRLGVIEGLSASHRLGDREVAQAMRRLEAERDAFRGA
jgi:transcriptional regulator